MCRVCVCGVVVVVVSRCLFLRHLEWIETHWRGFDEDRNVSVFETNIRVLGGLLSSHLLAKSLLPPARAYNDTLLRLATDLGDRLLAAFTSSPSGMPYGTVNLRHGVPAGETTVTSTAGTATFAIEFGVLSALTGNGSYAVAAKRAVKAMWSHRSPLNLVGNHIDIASGAWVHLDCSIGGSIDSFYEYLLKGASCSFIARPHRFTAFLCAAAVLFSDADYMAIYETAYGAIVTHSKVGPWYVEVHPNRYQLQRAKRCDLTLPQWRPAAPLLWHADGLLPGPAEYDG